MKSAGVIADGRESSSLDVVTPLGKDAFLFTSTQNTVDGDEVPDPPPLKFMRDKASS
jgi:hypothetical protein